MVRILLVEDDLLVADIVQTMLRSRGYDVDWAANGDDAIRLDLVLCDVQMRGKDGFEVIAETRQFSPNIPIVSMTAIRGTRVALTSTRASCGPGVEALLPLPALAICFDQEVRPPSVSIIERQTRRDLVEVHHF